MYAATKDLILPTTVVGSWPRPSWYTDDLAGRALSERLAETHYREQFLDAISTLVSDQEYAGLDVLTNGDYHLDADFAGRSWFLYPVERLGGVTRERHEQTTPVWGDPVPGAWEDVFPPGMFLREIFASWRFPRVVDRIREGVPLEFAKIWRIAQARTDKPVKFGTISPDCACAPLTVDTDVYSDDRRAMMWDVATVINRELRELVAAGCKAIQVEEPFNHHITGHVDDPAIIDFYVDLFNYTVSGLDDAEVWVHTCWGNPGAQKSASGDYEASLELHLERLDADVWTIESKHDGHRTLPLFAPYKGHLSKKIAVGFVDHRALAVERPEEVADDIRTALEYIDAENLIVSSDCGFGRQGVSRSIALYKAAALAQGAATVKRELGLDVAPVPAAQPDRQVDIPAPQQPVGELR